MESLIKQNLSSMFHDITDLLFILDIEGRILEANKAAIQTLGYGPNELNGQSILQLHPENTRIEALSSFHQMVSENKATCTFPLIRKDKRLIPVETKLHKGKWKGQEVIISLNRNLSELTLTDDKFAKLFNLGNVIMSISTYEEGIYINVNRPFLEKFGYTEEEMIGRTSQELNIYADYSERSKLQRKLTVKDKIENKEFLLRKKNGEVIPCLCSIDVIKYGKKKYLLASVTDISEQKKSEAQLQVLLKQQSLVADISQKIIHTRNLTNDITEILKMLGQHLGITRVNLLKIDDNKQSISCLYDWSVDSKESNRHNLQSLKFETIPSLKNIIKREGKVISNDINLLENDLRQHFLSEGIKSILIYPLYVKGELFGTIGFDECEEYREWQSNEIDLLQTISNIISNALEREESALQMQENEMRLNLAIIGANEGLWDWKIEESKTYRNNNWYTMLGYDPHGIEKDRLNWREMIHPDDREMVFMKLQNHLDRKTSFYETIYRLRAKDGIWKWILERGNVTKRDENGRALRMIGTQIDITQQKENELKLKELIATRDKLFSIIAHDLRGPIGTLLQVLQLLTSDHDIDEQTEKEFLKDLKIMSENAYQLLENLLNWSKSQRNEIAFQPKCIELAPLMKEFIRIHQNMANQKNIQIICEECNEPRVYADPNMVNLIIRNLLSNALKFTPKGGKITVRGVIVGRFIQIAITDTGVGMSEDFLKMLFQPNKYYTTHGTENESGSGLGLLLCKDFVEKNKGKIRVESKPGEGSTFYFTLPLCDRNP